METVDTIASTLNLKNRKDVVNKVEALKEELKEAKVEVVNEVAISKTLVLVTYSDGTSEIRFKLTSDELEKLVAAVSPADEEDEDEDEENL